MPLITRPEDINIQNSAQINPNAAAAAGSGAINLGQAVSRVGQEFQDTRVGQLAAQVSDMVSAEGRDYFEKTKRAHQTGALSNAMADATMEFVKAQDGRLKESTDKDGNPTFMKLPDDIKSIGDSIKERVSSKLSDPEVAAAFRNDFSSYVSNQQLMALKKARTQQGSYVKNSLDKGLGALITQGASDDIENLGSYEVQGKKLLDNARASGAMSQEEHAVASQQFSYMLKQEALKNSIQTNPDKAAQVLQGSPESLGIPAETKDQLTNQLHAKVTSDKIEVMKAQEVAKQDAVNGQALLAEKLDSRIEAGAMREDELLSNFGKVSEPSFKKLKQKYIAKAKQEEKTMQALGEVSFAVANGQDMSAFTPKVINDHYSRVVEAQSQQQGSPISLQQKAQISSIYRTKMPSFAKELDASVISGNAKIAADAVRAYTYSRDRKSKALDGTGFSKKAEMIAEHAEFLSERAGMDLETAVTKARDIESKNTDAIRKERSAQFNKLSALEGKELLNTVADYVDAENMFLRNKAVTEDAALSYRQFVKDAYLENGDIGAAKKYAASQMNKTHGMSAVNGKESYMYAPPEQLFPGIPSEEFRFQFQDEVKARAPDIDSSKIGIYSDAMTRGTVINVRDKATGQVRQIELISYGLQVTDPETGTSLPFVDPNTGESPRWYPDINKISNKLQTEYSTNMIDNVNRAMTQENKIKSRSSAENTLDELTSTPGGGGLY